MAKKYWLMKTEPNTYSIDDLKKDKRTLWDGVRNYQARNFMMKDMNKGDEILIYHSRVEPMAIVGVAKVNKAAQPDPTQFDKKSKYFDEKASKDSPRWFCVEVAYKETLKTPVTLKEIKATKTLNDMLLIKRGMRLSIQPVTKKQYDQILKLH